MIDPAGFLSSLVFAISLGVGTHSGSLKCQPAVDKPDPPPVLRTETFAALGLMLVGDAPPAFDPNPPRMVTVLSVHDGDTFLARTVTVNAPGVKQTTDIAVRVQGYDAPEISTNIHGKADPVNGPKARQALIDLLNSGQVWVRYTGEFSFDRSVGQVWVVGKDGQVVAVADRMKALGFDVPAKAAK